MGEKHQRLILDAQQLIQARGGRAWQVIPGVIWCGHVLQKAAGKVLLSGAYPYTMFSPDEPDLHIWVPEIITPDMVGQTIARFGKIEAKVWPDKLKPGQRAKLEFIASHGGMASVITRMRDNSIKWEDF